MSPLRQATNSNLNLSPSFITGINIRIAGRLSTTKITVRKIVKITQRGSIARNNTDIVSKARFTAINKRGTFCISVIMGQKLTI